MTGLSFCVLRIVVAGIVVAGVVVGVVVAVVFAVILVGPTLPVEVAKILFVFENIVAVSRGMDEVRSALLTVGSMLEATPVGLLDKTVNTEAPDLLIYALERTATEAGTLCLVELNAGIPDDRYGCGFGALVLSSIDLVLDWLNDERELTGVAKKYFIVNDVDKIGGVFDTV